MRRRWRWIATSFAVLAIGSAASASVDSVNGRAGHVNLTICVAGTAATTTATPTGATPTVTVTPTPTKTATPTPFVCTAGQVLDRAHPEACVVLPTPDGAGGGASYPTPTVIVSATPTPLNCPTAYGGILGGVFGLYPPQCLALVTPTPTATASVTPTATATSAPTATTTAFVCGAGFVLDRAHPEACVALPTPDGGGGGATPTPQMTPAGALVYVENGAPAGSTEVLILSNPHGTSPALVLGPPVFTGSGRSGSLNVSAEGATPAEFSLFADGIGTSEQRGVSSDDPETTNEMLYYRTNGTFATTQTGVNVDDVIQKSEWAGADSDLALQYGVVDKVYVAAVPSPSYVPMNREWSVGGNESTFAVVLRLLGLTHDVALPQKPSCSVLGTTTGGVIECKATVTPVPSATPTAVVCATNAAYGLGGLFKANPLECQAVGPTNTPTATASVTPTGTATAAPSATPTPVACATDASGFLGGLYGAHPELCKALVATVTPVPTRTPPWLNSDLPKPLIIGPTITPTATATSVVATPTATAVTPTPTISPTPALVVGPLPVTFQNYPSCALITSNNGTIECDSLTSITRLGPLIGGDEITNPFTIPSGTQIDGGSGASASAWDVPRMTDCSAVTTEGRICWDTDDNVLYEGDGAASAGMCMLAGTQTITGAKTFSAALTATNTVLLGPGPTSTAAATPTATAATPTATAASPTPTATASPPVRIMGRLEVEGDLTFSPASRTLKVGACKVPPCVGGSLSILGGDATTSGAGGAITVQGGSGAAIGPLGGTASLVAGVGGGNAVVTARVGLSNAGGEVYLDGNLVSRKATSGNAPTITANCGTSPSIVGTNNAFRVTVGTGGTDSACTITFADGGFVNAPVCTANYDTAPDGTMRTQTSTTTVVITNYDVSLGTWSAGAYPASSVLNVLCIARE